jgi:hypothetical protein
MQLGALKKEPQLAMLKYFNDSQLPNNRWPTDKKGNQLREEIAPLSELLGRAMDPNFTFMHNAEHPLNLSDEEVTDINELHEHRNNLAHIKPNHWSLETTGLPRKAAAIIKAIEHLFVNCPARIHLESDEINVMEGHLRAIRQQLT